MKISYIKSCGKYDIAIRDYVYDNIRLFSMRNQIDELQVDTSLDDFDPSDYLEDTFFYEGIIIHDSSLDQECIQLFQEKKVFNLSNGHHNTILFYLSYSNDYNQIYFYKKNIMKLNEDHLILTLDVNLESISAEQFAFSVKNFYTLNERYAIISYHFANQRYYQHALIDSLTGQLLPINSEKMLSDMDYITGFINHGKNYLLIKTGEYMVEERNRLWRNNEENEEGIYIIELDEFIIRCKNNDLNSDYFNIFFSLKNQAIRDINILNGKVTILIEEFDLENSSLITYDTFEKKIEKNVYSELYNRIYNSNEKLYVTTQSDILTSVYDLQTNTKIKEIYQPQNILAFFETGILTKDMRLGDEDKKLYINTEKESKLLIEGNYFIDIERNVIVIIDEN